MFRWKRNRRTIDKRIEMAMIVSWRFRYVLDIVVGECIWSQEKVFNRSETLKKWRVMWSWIPMWWVVVFDFRHSFETLFHCISHLVKRVTRVTFLFLQFWTNFCSCDCSSANAKDGRLSGFGFEWEQKLPLMVLGGSSLHDAEGFLFVVAFRNLLSLLGFGEPSV